MSKEPVEYFDTDFLNNKIEIGDKVIIEEPKYRNFIIGTVVSKAPKSCQIEYVDFVGDKQITRQYYGQIIKYPSVKEGKWIFEKHAGQEYYRCSCCGKDYPLPPTWNTSDIKQYLKFCSACGAKMNKED